jgi:hypothetical protein
VGNVRADNAYTQGLPDWLLGHMTLLECERHGSEIDRLQHCFQTATHAFGAGEVEQYVICALVQDIGVIQAPANPAETGVLIFRSFISEQTTRCCAIAEFFSARISITSSALTATPGSGRVGIRISSIPRISAINFNRRSFDPKYDTKPLEAFAPMDRKTLAARKR